jgi:Spy/CpxP family protein refolding chaperone
MKSIGCSLLCVICIFLLISGFPSIAQDKDDHNRTANLLSPYIGQEAREIRTLSEEDIHQLQNGEGWGLAKAAELNGYPGPAHLLEMADQGIIHISGEQLDQIRSLYQDVKARAVQLGLKLIEQERELNRRFATGDITEEELRHLVRQIAETTAELRYVHLSTHLQTLPILTPHQINTYNRVRGYTTGESVSTEDGVHSPQMHRP